MVWSLIRYSRSWVLVCLRLLIRSKVKGGCDGKRRVVGIASRVDIVHLLAVIPSVAKSIPVDALWSFAGGEGGGERVEVHLPARHVVVARPAGPVAVAVLVKAEFACVAVAPGSEDRARVVVEAVEFRGRGGPGGNAGDPSAAGEGPVVLRKR